MKLPLCLFVLASVALAINVQTTNAADATTKSATTKAADATTKGATTKAADATTKGATTKAADATTKGATTKPADATTKGATTKAADATTKSATTKAADATTKSATTKAADATTKSATTVAPTTTPSSNNDTTVDPAKTCQELHGGDTSVNGTINSANPCLLDCVVPLRRSRTRTVQHLMPDTTSCGTDKVCFKGVCRSNADDASKACISTYGSKALGIRRNGRCQVMCITQGGQKVRTFLPVGTVCKINGRRTGHCTLGPGRRCK